MSDKIMKFLRKLCALFRRKNLEAEMAEEMRQHLERRTQEKIADGLSPDEACYAAQREFGGLAQVQEQCRDERARGVAWLERTVRDARFALRSLRRSPGFTVTAVLTLALGIGANTTAFSVLNALLLHVPPYPEPATLVRLQRVWPGGLGGAHASANFWDYRAQNSAFAHIAAVQRTSLNFGGPGQAAERLPGLFVTADFLPLLRVAPALGRNFTTAEEQPGSEAVVMLTYDAWQQRFGGDPAVVGRTVRIDGGAATIVGVVPAAFGDVQLWGPVAVLRPLVFSDYMRRDRDNTTLTVVARLNSGLSRRQAEAAVNVLSARLAAAYPETNRNLSLRLIPLASSQDDTSRRITWLIVGLAGFVLLIACANLANLQLARNAARGREHAIRTALGASRMHLMRLVLTESVLLALAGGALALGLAVWTNHLAGRAFDFGGSTSLNVPLDVRVLGFTLIVSVVTGVGFGLLPAWIASHAAVGDALKRTSRGGVSGRGQNRVRQALVVAEIALALVLLAGAGFFVRGLRHFTARDPGWKPDGLLTAALSLRGENYASTAARDAFYRRLHERLAALPGVESVAIGSSLPTAGFSVGNSFVIEGQSPPEPGASPEARVAAVTPGYFDVLGIRLLQGRDFSATDTTDKPMVVVINESMARQFWPGQNPIGKRLGGATPFMSNPREVIGVVSDVRAVASLDNGEGRFQFYRALTQWNLNGATIAVRAKKSPEMLTADLRHVLAGIDPDQAVYDITTVRHEIVRSLGSVDAAGYGLMGFAAVGLLLAAVGIYGVMAYSVVQRTNEIGLRMALGAHVRDVFALIVTGGLRLTLIGTAVGMAGALGIGRVLHALAPELSTSEFAVIATLTPLLVTVALAACWLPARRATKVDPMVALRAE